MRKRPALFGIPLGQWLTVLVIIAVVGTVLYPVFQKVRDPQNDNRHNCATNMKIFGLAFVQYEQDADEQMPPGRNAAGNGWASQVHSYANYGDVYMCPQDPQEGSYISYAENRNIAGQSYASFTAPAGTVELYEFTTLNCDPARPEAVSATGLAAPQDSRRHDDPPLYPFALNFLYADGHVKKLTLGQVSNGSQAVPPTHKGKYQATFAVE